ncbi:MAG: leucine-rich repeat protein [Ruminococcus sp.]|nr:leucine-rich repeat protein [Ruminococcus sp.]
MRKMKRFFAGILAGTIGAASLTVCPVQAVQSVSESQPIAGESCTYGDLTYEISYPSDEIIIRDCDSAAVSVEIPSEIDGLPVTKIDSFSFEGCTALAEITIPDGVTCIGSYAFYGCTALTEITIPDGVVRIEEYAFRSCTALAEITIPDSAVDFGEGVFSGTAWLSTKRAQDPLVIVNSILIDGTACEGEVLIPDGVTSISVSAFKNNSNITSVTIPDRVTSIQDYAFSGSGLNEAVIPESVTYIGNDAFGGTNWMYYRQKEDPIVVVNGILIDAEKCEGEVIVPEGVTSIAGHAFYHSDGITKVTLPDTLTRIGSGAFYNCAELLEITIPESVTSIGSAAFFGCKGLTEAAILGKITSIESGLFRECTGLERIVLPDSVTCIGDVAFYSCAALSEITIPEGVTSIGSGAFCGCTGLSAITIPASVTDIASSAFYSCGAIEVTLLCENANIAQGAFDPDAVILPGSLPIASYWVKYDVNAGEAYSGFTEMSSTKYEDEAVEIIQIIPSWHGYTFLGWSSDPDGEVEYTAGDLYTENADITLYGVWEKLPEYTITFDPNGGTFSEYAVTNKVKLQDEDITLYVEAPTREGYTLLGWASAPEGEVLYESGDVYTENADITLYAVWEEIPSYIITYDLRSGYSRTEKVVNDLKYQDEDYQILNETPVWDGYHFVGWALEPGGQVLYEPGDSYTKNEALTLYAIWRLVCTHCEGDGIRDIYSSCLECGGSGTRSGTSECTSCGGSGTRKQINGMSCPSCGGDGVLQDTGKTCTKCSGGWYTYTYMCICPNCGGAGSVSYTNVCRGCNGQGSFKVGTESCPFCNGVGDLKAPVLEEVQGDADGDGLVEVTDASLVLTLYAKTAAGLSVDEFTERKRKAADVDGNGVINIRDATAVLTYYAQYAAGLDPDWEEILT